MLLTGKHIYYEVSLQIQKVRDEIGEDAVLLGNTNARYDAIDEILPMLSGNFMESVWYPVGNDDAVYLDYIFRTVEMCQEMCREPKLINTEAWS